jgi:hypothetical protein
VLVSNHPRFLSQSSELLGLFPRTLRGHTVVLRDGAALLGILTAILGRFPRAL